MLFLFCSTGFAEPLTEPIKSLNNPKYVALTFDDGPSKHTDALLAMLKEQNVKATFFLLGSNVKHRPKDVLKIYEDGHLIASHALTHKKLTEMEYEAVFYELHETNDRIEAITGERPKYMRAPYGLFNEILMKACDEENLIPIDWSNDSKDWKKDTTIEQIETRVISKMKPGDIILMHQNTSIAIKSLPAIIEAYQNAGCEFIRVGD